MIKYVKVSDMRFMGHALHTFTFHDHKSIDTPKTAASFLHAFL